MMKQSLHYFPCINSFVTLLQSSILSFDGDNNFKRASFRNRMIIAGANGPITLSIPIVGGRNVKLLYKEVEIDFNNNWQRDHFRTLSSAYGSSPFFQFYKDELAQLYTTPTRFLYEWNFNCLDWVFRKMKISPEYLDNFNSLETSNSPLVFFEYTPSNYLNLSEKGKITYTQVFQDKIGFLPNISILDLLFNQGSASKQLLLNSTAKLRSKTTV